MSTAARVAGRHRLALSAKALKDGKPSGSKPKEARRKRPNHRAKTVDNLERLLSRAASLMARCGYEKTSLRDVARETGFSLAGMYYYFKGKEDLLFKIQNHTFGTLLREQEGLAAGEGTPEEKLRRLVLNHLSYLISHASELKVCTFEMESLKGDHYRRIEELRRRYYRLMAGLISQLMGHTRNDRRNRADVRHQTLLVFGMLNWVFMWFDPRRDGPPEELGRKLVDLALRGLTSSARGSKVRAAGRTAVARSRPGRPQTRSARSCLRGQKDREPAGRLGGTKLEG